MGDVEMLPSVFTDVLCVFSTKELAEQCVKDLNNNEDSYYDTTYVKEYVVHSQPIKGETNE